MSTINQLKLKCYTNYSVFLKYIQSKNENTEIFFDTTHGKQRTSLARVLKNIKTTDFVRTNFYCFTQI